jgi:hypothetical protein
MLFSPAGVQFSAVHLFAGGSGVSGRYDCIKLIDDDRSKIATQAGALVGTTQRKIKEIVVPVGSHSTEYRKTSY